MLFWFRKVHSGAGGEVSAEKWESWDFLHTTVLPQLISAQIQTSDWFICNVQNSFDQSEKRILKSIRRVCTQPENHNKNQGHLKVKVACLSFFSLMSVRQSNATMSRKPYVDILGERAKVEKREHWEEVWELSPMEFILSHLGWLDSFWAQF